MISFRELIKQRITDSKSVLCVGLDTVEDRIPPAIQEQANPQFYYNQKIIESTHDLVCCYKPNLAFYLVQGAQGVDTLRETIECAHSFGVPVILDAKFGDIGHTTEFYAKTVFETLQADAVTLNPYMGIDSIASFREYEEKGLFILCFTSNLSRSDVQMQKVLSPAVTQKEIPLYLHVAERIREWNTTGNVGAVVGATAPEELEEIREILGEEALILCPGVGAQGGDLEEILWAGEAFHGSLIVNVSRSILYASGDMDFAEAARREAEMFVEQTRTYFEQAKEN
ncbi:MAG: orotidine-5'-phosphate decarboxylase [bacterium]|jgi:orotidine-5'-phosphate decarboxylase